MIKYADNILKSFATAVSIVTSTIVSAWVFGFLISKLFVGGCLLVFIAIALYSRKDPVSSSPESKIPSSPPQRLPAQTSEIAMMRVDSRKSSGLSMSDEESGLELKGGGR